MRRYLATSVLLALVALAPAVVRADAESDRKAELERKKAEAKKKADERKAAKAAAAAAGGATGAGGTSSSAGAATTATGGAAGKSAGGTSSGGATAAAGGAGGKSAGGAGGTAGKGGAGGAGGAVTKADEKDAPLPAGDIETLRKDRADRRKTTVERLRKRWGSLLASEQGTADLKQHARRVAFLQRIRVVAETKKDPKTVEAVDELLTQEDTRHASAMNALREGALPAGTK